MTQQKVTGRQVSANLNDLADVEITSPVDGQVLTYNSGNWSADDAAGGTAYFNVAQGVVPTQFTFNDNNNFASPSSNVPVTITPTGPIVMGSTLELTNANFFQEYLATFANNPNATVTSGYTFQFTAARKVGSIGMNLFISVQHSPSAFFSLGFASYSIFYQSHSAFAPFIDSFHVRDDNNNELIPVQPDTFPYLQGDGLWATPTTSRDIVVTVTGATLDITIKGVQAGSFKVGRQYKIATVGTTNFVAIGASANTVGVVFTATGVGTGDGVADVFYSLTLPNAINTFAGNKFWRLSITGGGQAGGGTGPGSPGNIPALISNVDVTGVAIPPAEYVFNASPTHDTFAFPNLRLTQGVGQITVEQQAMQLLDNANPYGNVQIIPVTGDYPNIVNNATTQVVFNQGLRAALSGVASEIVTVDSFITTNGDPTLQLYHFNNIDGGLQAGTITERITGAVIDANGYLQEAPGEYGVSALHNNPSAGGDLDLLTTPLPFSQWTMEFSLRKPGAAPRVDGRIFTVNRIFPYPFNMYVIDNVTDWDLEIRNSSGNLVYANLGNPMDTYIKWAIAVDLVQDSWALFRNGVSVFNGTAIGSGQLFPPGTPTSIPWNMQLRPLDGGGEADPDSNGVLIDELRLTPRDLYNVSSASYLTTPNEFPVTDLFEATTIAQYPGMRVTPISNQQVTIEPQHLVITDDNTVTMEVPSGDLAIPRTLVFDTGDFLLTPSGPDNEVLTVTSLGGGGGLTIQDEGSTLTAAATSINFVGAGVTASGGPAVTVTIPGGGGSVSEPAQQIVYGKTGMIATLTITNGGTGGASNVIAPDIFLSAVTGTGQGAIATFTTDGSGVVTAVTLTDFGFGYQVGDTLTDNGNISAGPFLLTVASIQTGITSAPSTMMDPLTGLVAINYDTFNDDFYNINTQFGKIVTLTNLVGGTGYVDGTYLTVPLTGINGYNAHADITVAGGIVTAVTPVELGIGSYGYEVGEPLTLRDSFALGSTTTGGSGFSIDVDTVNAVGANEPFSTQIYAAGSRSSKNYLLGGGSLILSSGGADFTAGAGSATFRAADVYADDYATSSTVLGGFVQITGPAATSPSNIDINAGGTQAVTGRILSFSAFAGGAGYTNGVFSAQFTGGTGQDAAATFTIAGGAVVSLTGVFGAYGYQVGDVLSVLAANVGGTGAGFSVTVGTVNAAPDGVSGSVSIRGGRIAGPGVPSSTADNLASLSFPDVTITGTTSDSTNPNNAGRVVITTGTDNTAAERVIVDQLGNVIAGVPSIAVGATDGFVYIPTLAAAGPPVGTPTTYAGMSPMLIEDTAGVLTLWVYQFTGTPGWKSVTLT
jgi:hypothetical protein